MLSLTLINCFTVLYHFNDDDVRFFSLITSMANQFCDK